MPTGSDGRDVGAFHEPTMGMMNNMVFSVAVLLVIAAGSFAYLRWVTPVSEAQWWVAAAAAFAVLVAAWYVRVLLRVKRYRFLLRDATSGRPPRDAEAGFFIGTIESRESVRAPLSGRNVVAYRYAIDWAKPSTSGRTSSTYYSGSASVRWTLVTATGSYPLLCAPALSVDSVRPSAHWSWPTSGSMRRAPHSRARFTPGMSPTRPHTASTAGTGMPIRIGMRRTSWSSASVPETA